MADSGLYGLARILKAITYSWKGLLAAWRHEAAFREEACAALVLTPVALYFGEGGLEKAMLITSVVLVLMAEMINSAIEACVDRYGSEHHELAGRAKDIASTAVAFALLLVPVVWILVLFVD